jgi:hypothetical protein
MMLSFGAFPRKNPMTNEIEPVPLADAYFPIVADTEWCGEWERRRAPTSAIQLEKLELSQLEGNA